MERIALVNEQDEVIGDKPRSERTPDDIYRVSALWVTSSQGDVLLGKRAKGKKYAGAWSSAVAGTVEAGESYDDNIVKETAEEIGVEVPAADLVRGPKMRFKNEQSNHFCQWYFYVTDKAAEEFVPQESEIEYLQWFSPSELKRMRQESPEAFSPSTIRALDEFLP